MTLKLVSVLSPYRSLPATTAALDHSDVHIAMFEAILQSNAPTACASRSLNRRDGVQIKGADVAGAVSPIFDDGGGANQRATGAALNASFTCGVEWQPARDNYFPYPSYFA